MCLLITQNKNSQKLSNEWLEDFYSSNSDGLGVMYAQDNELIVEKFLPKNAKDLCLHTLSVPPTQYGHLQSFLVLLTILDIHL